MPRIKSHFKLNLIRFYTYDIHTCKTSNKQTILLLDFVHHLSIPFVFSLPCFRFRLLRSCCYWSINASVAVIIEWHSFISLKRCQCKSWMKITHTIWSKNRLWINMNIFRSNIWLIKMKEIRNIGYYSEIWLNL